MFFLGQKFLRRWRRAARFLGDEPHPAQPLFIVGDLHGRVDLLEALFARVPQEWRASQIIFVGDLIDRGADSARVLRQVFCAVTDEGAICLLGNHEQMLLRFLDDPRKNGAAWLRYGGLQTLESFGIRASLDDQNEDKMTRIRDELQAALGKDTEAWLRGLPSYFVSGNVAVTHAGADPALPVAMQPDHNLIWGNENFKRVARADGMWVVHGHTIVERAEVAGGVISIDTGAYKTGELTAVRVAAGALEFIHT